MDPRDLADIAADKLTRLAEDLEAAAGIPAHATIVTGIAVGTVAESRREAAGALERLQMDSLPSPWEEDAARQCDMLLADIGYTVHDLARWAAAWRAFADAA